MRQKRELVVPLYTEADVAPALKRFKVVPLGEWYRIDESIKALHTEAGHIIGSTCVHLRITEDGETKTITFSGDVGRYHDAILSEPAPFPQADVILMESTYGNREHDQAEPQLERFLKVVQATCVEKKGKLIIPSFSVGRTQELLYALNTLFLQQRLPKVPYYVDSPLSVEATELVKKFPKLFNDKVQKVLEQDDDPFGFPSLQLIKDVEESKAINSRNQPCVIISSSGMAEAGRVKHHIANSVENSKNTILFVGYCEPNSLGGKLRAGNKEVKIFGEEYQVNAEVCVIEGMSAHGDYHDLLHWLECQNPAEVKQFFLVHGEYEAQVAMRERLVEKGFKHVAIPSLHQTFEI